jgi:hypothetical protein
VETLDFQVGCGAPFNDSGNKPAESPTELSTGGKPAASCCRQNVSIAASSTVRRVPAGIGRPTAM